MDQELVKSIEIPLDKPSLFKSTLDSSIIHSGAFSERERDIPSVKRLALAPTAAVILAPIYAGMVPIGTLYLDGGRAGAIPDPDLLRIPELAFEIGNAFKQIIQYQKKA